MATFNATLIPNSLRPTGPMALHGRGIARPGASMAVGIYVSEFYSTDIYGYSAHNMSNDPPTCSVSPADYPNDVASDTKGELIDPDGGTHSIIIYKGPALCGAEVGSINDPYGQPSDAASANAMKNTIAVANIYDAVGFGNAGPGSISVCTFSGGCTSNLTNSNMYQVAGVALASNGDCWADSVDSSGTAWLTYFAGCAGSGQTATGFSNVTLGGLDIDKKGHLLAIDAYSGELYVYSGCNPACTLVNGPQTLEGNALFGHLDASSMHFATADFEYGQVDVYSYDAGTAAIKYLYSFNNGLSASDDVEGAAYTPAAHY
jgi:hypothetical protein